MSEFAGKEMEFAAGSLHGLRGWGMDEHGRLHGVTHREVWRPGENVSVCRAEFKVPCPGPKPEVAKMTEQRLAEEAVQAPKAKRRGGLVPGRLHFSLHTGGTHSCPCGCGMQYESWELPPHVKTCNRPECRGDGYHRGSADHHFKPDCQCGFWAYDEAGFTPHGDVVGVIEAYGKTTIGTKGFRAEKARIVAICKQDGIGKPLTRSVVGRLADLYPQALLCDDLDTMVSAFQDVLHQYEVPGEDFWSKPVPKPRGEGWATGGMLTLPTAARYFTGMQA